MGELYGSGEGSVFHCLVGRGTRVCVSVWTGSESGDFESYFLSRCGKYRQCDTGCGAVFGEPRH
jgi:hypothetical protein